MKPTLFNKSEEYQDSVQKKILSINPGEKEAYQKILSQIVEKVIRNSESSPEVFSSK